MGKKRKNKLKAFKTILKIYTAFYNFPEYLFEFKMWKNVCTFNEYFGENNVNV